MLISNMLHYMEGKPQYTPLVVRKSAYPQIIRERIVNKKKEWLVQFSDRSHWWCDDVTPALIKEFRVRQARRRKRR